MGSDEQRRALPYPTVLQRLTARDSFPFGSAEALLTRHLREVTGTDLPVGTPVDDAAVVDHWVSYFTDRILTDRDTTAIIDGSPGEGKSQLGLFLCAKIRDRLGREMGGPRKVDLANDVVYRLSALIHRVSQSSRARPSVILCDEAVLAGGQATSGVSDTGRILDKVLSISRIKGCTLFLLAPSVWGLANFVRSRRARVLFHVEARGRATVLTLKSAMDFSPPRTLPMVKARSPWHVLRWESIETDPIWARYEKLKLEAVAAALTDAEMEASKIEKKAGLRPLGAWQMDWYNAAGSGRAEGETPEEYHRRGNRDRMRARRADTKRTRLLARTEPTHRQKAWSGRGP